MSLFFGILFCCRCFGFQISAIKLTHERKASSGIWSIEISESQVMFSSEQWNRVCEGENSSTQKRG